MRTRGNLQRGSARCLRRPPVEVARNPSRMQMVLAPVVLPGAMVMLEDVPLGACASLRRLGAHIALAAPCIHAHLGRHTRAAVRSSCRGTTIMVSSARSFAETRASCSTIQVGWPRIRLWLGPLQSGSGSLAGHALRSLERDASPVVMMSSWARRRSVLQMSKPVANSAWVG